MNIFYAVSIYTNKYKHCLNIRSTLTILTSFVAIIAAEVVLLEEQLVRLKWSLPWRWASSSEIKVTAPMPLCVVGALAKSVRSFEALVEPPCPPEILVDLPTARWLKKLWRPWSRSGRSSDDCTLLVPQPQTIGRKFLPLLRWREVGREQG